MLVVGCWSSEVEAPKEALFKPSQGFSKAVELGVEKHCYCSSKELQLMVKRSAFAGTIPLRFLMHLNQTEIQYESN
ncbi:MAG: hypothetical protein IKW23_00900 [Kiritimatiellae bacterium]|nr:hypothetical protein [Kiritimatiellia bacterium]